ncbi:unnamed protein product [Rangifer tarandus platyrhynchus]|uniref:Uncharacterized protein n=1 Tax=Rangifer tarandus platyrhynchus TaxID=3082113 RepID=A0AC59YXE1_RANTA
MPGAPLAARWSELAEEELGSCPPVPDRNQASSRGKGGLASLCRTRKAGSIQPGTDSHGVRSACGAGLCSRLLPSNSGRSCSLRVSSPPQTHRQCVQPLTSGPSAPGTGLPRRGGASREHRTHVTLSLSATPHGAAVFWAHGPLPGQRQGPAHRRWRVYSQPPVYSRKELPDSPAGVSKARVAGEQGWASIRFLQRS